MSFNYLLTFKASFLIGILIDMVISSNQKCYKTENISNPTGPIMMALP